MTSNPPHLLPATYFHTQGARILDANNQPVRLAGVNWYGFESLAMVPGGLDKRPLPDIARTIADLGFNCVRLPFSVQLIQTNPTLTRYLDANANLQGKPALAIFDAVIEALGAAGLKVILDNHLSEAGWGLQSNGLWHTQAYPESAWIAAWQTLAHRYAGSHTIIGCDLRNEPGSPPTDPTAWPANGGSLWGYGGPERDWQDAAGRAGNAILAINPNWLIFVEGVRFDPAGPQSNRDWYWFGGNLKGVGNAAIPHRWTHAHVELDAPNRLVYSVHDYGPQMSARIPWMQPGTTAATPDASHAIWDEVWGYIVQQEIAPIWIGEFGTPNGRRQGETNPPEVYTDPNDITPQGAWFTYLVDYIQQHDINWCYWALNGTQSEAPTRNPNHVEGYGVLDPAWLGPASAPMMARLRTIQ